MASEKMLKGVCANRNPKKKTGIDFYSGLRKNCHGGENRNPKKSRYRLL